MIEAVLSLFSRERESRIPPTPLLFMRSHELAHFFILHTRFRQELGNQSLSFFDPLDGFVSRFLSYDTLTTLQDGLERSDYRTSLVDVSDTRIAFGVVEDTLGDVVSGITGIKFGVLVKQANALQSGPDLVGIGEFLVEQVQGGALLYIL